MAVTDPKLIKELDELRLKNVGSNIKSSGETVDDPDLIKELDDIRLQNTFKGKITKTSNAVADFFSGTKKTEFPDMNKFLISWNLQFLSTTPSSRSKDILVVPL